MRQPIAGLSGKFNLISTLSALSVRVRRPGGTRKALTLQTAPFIRPALAAGAIPPPLFFERRRHSAYLTSAICSENGILLRTSEKPTSVDHAVEWPGRPSPTASLPPKDS
jgi:hypothetical protein